MEATLQGLKYLNSDLCREMTSVNVVCCVIRRLKHTSVVVGPVLLIALRLRATLCFEHRSPQRLCGFIILYEAITVKKKIGSGAARALFMATACEET